MSSESFPSREEFLTPKEQGEAIDERELIAELAQHLAAGDSDDSFINAWLKKYGQEAGEYMRRMHELQRIEKMEVKPLGPADYEDLRKFEKGVAKIERQMEFRKKMRG